MQIRGNRFVEDGPGWTDRSTMATVNTPFPPDHSGLFPNLVKDKARTDRNTLAAIDAFLPNDFRWIHVLLHCERDEL